MRIYEFAQKYGVDSKMVVAALIAEGVIDKPNAALSVDEKVARKALSAYRKEMKAQARESRYAAVEQMRVHEFAKKYDLNSGEAAKALAEAGLIASPNAASNVAVAEALEVCREAGLFEMKWHEQIDGDRVRDLKAGIEFFVGEAQPEVYSRAADHYAQATGEPRDSIKVRNLAYKVVLRGFRDGLILPSGHSGNPYGRGAWDPQARNREDYVAATGTDG
jgi:hypothetical protein